MAQPDWIALYLQEDLDDVGDITSDTLFAPNIMGRARMVARERCLLAGVAVASEIFARLGVKSTVRMNDGSWIDAGGVALEVQGESAAILKAERLALNVVSRMSGIATKTRTMAEQLSEACSGAVVAGTRKTTPGFRAFEKQAIVIGGGDPHRAGLFDAAMIKDNHREAAGSVSKATAAVRGAHPDVMVTVEAESLQDAMDAAEAGAHWILIDNQTPLEGKAWADALWAKYPALKIEASGGINADNFLEFGWADRISMGALTNAAASADFSLEWGA